MRTPVCERHNKPMTPIPVVQKNDVRGWTCRKCEREWLIYQRMKVKPRGPGFGPVRHV